MKQNTPTVLTATQLRQAADLADEIQTKQNQLTALLSGQPVTFSGSPTTVKTGKGKGNTGKRTPAQRAKIAEGLRAKWAERKAAAAKAAAPATPAPVTPTKVSTPVPQGGVEPATSSNS